MLAPVTPPAAVWINSLVNHKTLRVESSNGIVTALQRRQQTRANNGYAGPSKIPVVVPQFSPSIQSSLQPASLLHLIGLATTPPVPNLADLSSTWALYRYVWAFAHAAPHLCLSQTAKNIDFHQKGVLSGEMGVGMAYWLMSKYLHAGQPIDVDIAMRNPQLAASMGFPALQAIGDASPDYLYPLPNGNYAIVECKGSQSGRSASLDQLRRGLEQVPSIQFANGQQAKEYVIATLLSTDRVDVLVIDPPGDSDGKRGEKRSLEVENKESFDREVGNLRAASLLAYAGAEALARDISKVESEAEPFGFERRGAPTVIESEDLNAELRGRAATFPSRSDETPSVTVFMGLEDSVYQRLATGQDNLPQTEVLAPQSFRDLIPEGDRITAFVSGDGDRVISVDDSGTVFIIGTQ